MTLSFEVPGHPVPKGRPRYTATGIPYTPKQTRAYEGTVRLLAQAAVARARWTVDPDALYAVTIDVCPSAQSRADLDNVIKAITDAMNGIVYPDDARIDEIHAYRRTRSRTPHVTIRVEKRP